MLSTDDQIDAYASARGLSYSAAFDKVDFKSMEAIMFEKMHQALALGMDIVVDRTNLRRKSRRPFLERVGSEYYRVAMMFELAPDELQRRLDQRAATTGKFIPRHVIESMIEGFEAPDQSEFDRVIGP